MTLIALLGFAAFFLSFLVVPMAILVIFYVGFAARDRSKRKVGHAAAPDSPVPDTMAAEARAPVGDGARRHRGGPDLRLPAPGGKVIAQAPATGHLEGASEALTLSLRTGLPYTGLRGFTCDPKLLLYLPMAMAVAERVVPVILVGDNLKLASAGPHPNLHLLSVRFPYLAPPVPPAGSRPAPPAPAGTGSVGGDEPADEHTGPRRRRGMTDGAR